MRRRTLLEDNNGGNGSGIGSKAAPLSVVFANKSDKTLTIVEGDKWNITSYPKSSFEPIGIVVIPGEHGVLKDGTGKVNQCGVISLVEMDADNPTNGGNITNGKIYWGQYGVDISGKKDGLGRYDSTDNGLINYDQCVTVSNSDQTIPIGTTSYGYVPRQGSVGTKPVWNSSADSKKTYCPSPYAGDDMMSGGFNAAYSDTTQTVYNSLSDFKGIVNTKILTDLATKQSNWRTASTIANTSDNTRDGYSPAACCCARFKTTGTKAFVNCTTEELRKGTGFWYMPAAGELGYILPRLYDINDTISKLNTAYGVGFQLNTSRGHLSSTEFGIYDAVRIGTGVGDIYDGFKHDYGFATSLRAFMRL